ncbi:MAG: hypothetical protein O3C40_35140 [Planctomycetota bacterium]|nr:hypothetical protein [Planctomycetota bacterium]
MTDEPTPIPRITNPVHLTSTGVSPFADEPKIAVRFCLRCQAALPESPFADAACLDCQLQFDPKNPATYRVERTIDRLKFWFPGFCLAVASGVISYAACIQNGELGVALFVAVPISFGAVLGYAVRTGKVMLAILLFATVAGVATALMSLNVAGFFCGAMLCAIFLGPAVVGMCLGAGLRIILSKTRWEQRWFLPLALIIAFPSVSQWIECQLPHREEIATVRTTLTVDATPAEAWNAIMFYEQVQHDPPWLLQLALPKPIRSVGNKHRVGEIVRCYYDRGYLVKRISRRTPGRLLAFEVVEQKLHFERDVTLRDGAFEILPAPGDRATIVVTTRYQRHLSPRWLWRPVERKVVHTLHGHVLEGMRRHAEQNPLPAPTPQRDQYHRPKHPALAASYDYAYAALTSNLQPQPVK